MSTFEKLSAINVNERTEKKGNLTYLSWAWAWTELKNACPDASYKIWRDEEGNPYTGNAELGYMCHTEVTIEGETLEMWLPVMDHRNKAMTENATMTDINKTIMRCLTKNFAMFGLGAYIYAGEDLPEEAEEERKRVEELKKAKVSHYKKWKDLEIGAVMKCFLDVLALEPEPDAKDALHSLVAQVKSKPKLENVDKHIQKATK